MKKIFFIIFIILFGILISTATASILNISIDKKECYVGEEVNIDITIIPNLKGVYGYVYISKINGSIEELVNYPRGCSACGMRKSPLTSYFHKTFNKKFQEKGIYEIYGGIEDVDMEERNFTSIQIIVKERENKEIKNKTADEKDLKNISDNANNNSSYNVNATADHNNNTYYNNISKINLTTEEIEKILEEEKKISIINFIIKFTVWWFVK